MLGVLEDALARDDDLNLTSQAFENGGPLPDWTGFVNETENPPSTIGGVRDEAESLVSTIVHPEAADVVDHAGVHWTAWGIDPETEQIPRDWDASGATAGYRDFPRQWHGGPSPPPESVETYRFRVYAVDSGLSLPPVTRCRRLASTIGLEAEVVAADELTGTADANQGTVFETEGPAGVRLWGRRRGMRRSIPAVSSVTRRRPPSQRLASGRNSRERVRDGVVSVVVASAAGPLPRRRRA